MARMVARGIRAFELGDAELPGAENIIHTARSLNAGYYSNANAGNHDLQYHPYTR